MPDMNRAAIETLYQQHCARSTAISPHLARLRALANDCTTAVELGVKHGASTTALLLGTSMAHVISYDIAETPQARVLQMHAGDHWTYHIADSRNASPTPCDLLFIDSLHTFEQVDLELRQHADSAAKYLICHDTLTFGSVGANGETGQQLWTYIRGQSVPLSALGIRPAIDLLMMRDPTWRIMAHYLDSHGLLVLERRP